MSNDRIKEIKTEIRSCLKRIHDLEVEKWKLEGCPEIEIEVLTKEGDKDVVQTFTYKDDYTFGRNFLERA